MIFQGHLNFVLWCPILKHHKYMNYGGLNKRYAYMVQIIYEYMSFHMSFLFVSFLSLFSIKVGPHFSKEWKIPQKFFKPFKKFTKKPEICQLFSFNIKYIYTKKIGKQKENNSLKLKLLNIGGKCWCLCSACSVNGAFKSVIWPKLWKIS